VGPAPGFSAGKLAVITYAYSAFNSLVHAQTRYFDHCELRSPRRANRCDNIGRHRSLLVSICQRNKNLRYLALGKPISARLQRTVAGCWTELITPLSQQPDTASQSRPRAACYYSNGTSLYNHHNRPAAGLRHGNAAHGNNCMAGVAGGDGRAGRVALQPAGLVGLSAGDAPLV